MVTAEQINRFQLSIDSVVSAVNRRRWTRTKRTKIALFALLALLGIGLLWYLTVELPDRARRDRVFSVVRQLHGRIGVGDNPLPFSPFGNEYFVSFYSIELTPDDLQRLTVLNDLAGRHIVGVAFHDTNLNQQDLPRVRNVLSRCRSVDIESSAANQERSRKDVLP